MRIINKLEDIREAVPCSLALGAFDGLHRGHMAVIRAAVEKPLEENCAESGVLTFESVPSGSPVVLTPEDKRALLESQGVDRLYSFRFPDLRDIPAEEFVWKILFEKCRAARLCCGADFRFGKGARGDVSLLKRLCREAGARLTVVPPVLEGGEKISSTRIRAAAEAGDIPLANRLLGRPFGFSLEVIHGNHIGTGLGTPTINQAFPEGFVRVPFGVYASLVRIDGREHYGVTNIGIKPTVGSDRVLSETWIPDFSGDLYGRRLRVSLLEFIRPERKFDSLEELKAEIERNAVQAERIARQASFPGTWILPAAFER